MNSRFRLILLFISMLSQSSSCPRDRSRLSRNVLNEHFFPHFKKWQGRLSSSCPFRRSRDIYYDQERHKTRSQHWNCEYCGKSFYSEYFLDFHLENKHSDKLNAKESICLADYCDILRCDVAESGSLANHERPVCIGSQLEKLKRKCEVVDGDTSLEALNQDICGFLTCELYWTDPARSQVSYSYQYCSGIPNSRHPGPLCIVETHQLWLH
eukprot:m.98872 g.98872  ORF g.98872 m.98872 type:complete len:211 (+) comp37013_c0_seq14:1-633(+)